MCFKGVQMLSEDTTVTLTGLRDSSATKAMYGADATTGGFGIRGSWPQPVVTSDERTRQARRTQRRRANRHNAKPKK